LVPFALIQLAASASIPPPISPIITMPLGFRIVHE
jgi:hypothetical protein